MNTKWNGRNYNLEKFTGMRWSSYVQLKAASDHANFQLPTEHICVGYILDNINNLYPDLRAAIASIQLNTNGMRSNLETAVACLLPVESYNKHKRGQECTTVQVSDTNALHNKLQSFTQLVLRWHTLEE